MSLVLTGQLYEAYGIGGSTAMAATAAVAAIGLTLAGRSLAGRRT